jgi:hypothetical protein
MSKELSNLQGKSGQDFGFFDRSLENGLDKRWAKLLAFARPS